MALDMRGVGPLVLVGAGKMGGAMLAGWIERGLDPTKVTILDPAPPPEMTAFIAAHRLAAYPSAAAASARPASVVIIAVKPQMMGDALPPLAGFVDQATVVVSIAAGTPIKAFEAAFGGVAVVRAMPNTPAQVGRGITVAVANGRASADQRAVVEALLAAVGEVGWVEDEALIDAVTALSGSGPAYVFHLVEAMAQAGRKLGLSDDLAARLARATVEGAGELLFQSDLDPATLRKNVTSPGGTTAAALSVLMDETRGLPALMEEAMKAAHKRARELGG
jgi:pyrroline-5-carboxylate reductase